MTICEQASVLLHVCYMSPPPLDSVSLETGFPEVLLNRTEESWELPRPTINTAIKRIIFN